MRNASFFRNRNKVIFNKYSMVLLIPMWFTPLSILEAGESHRKTAKLASVAKVGNQEKIDKLSNYIEKKYRISPRKANTIVAEAIRNGKEHNLDPELILAIIAVESTFRERAVSRVGARGLMQVMPKYHPKKVREIGGANALFDPKKNIYTGSKILVSYLAKSRGNLRRALLRYNGSLGRKSRYPDRVLQEYNRLKRAA